MFSSSSAHQDSRSSNAFSEIAYLGFHFSFVVSQFGLFDCQLLHEVKKLLIGWLRRLGER